MKGNYKKMSKAFFSLLCVPGSLVVHKESKQSRVVLQSSVYGFWAARMPIESGSLQLRLLPCPQDAFTFEVVTKPEVWSAAEIEVLEPHTMPKQGGKLAMRFGKKSASLLKFSVTRLARRVCPSFVHIRAVGTLWLPETPFRRADWFACHAVAIGKHLAVAFMIPPCSGPLGCPGVGFLCAAKAQESETRWGGGVAQTSRRSVALCRSDDSTPLPGGGGGGRRWASRSLASACICAAASELPGRPNVCTLTDRRPAGMLHATMLAWAVDHSPGASGKLFGRVSLLVASLRALEWPGALVLQFCFERLKVCGRVRALGRGGLGQHGVHHWGLRFASLSPSWWVS